MTADPAVPTATLALRRTALLCAALMVVVVAASAFLRHHGTSVALQAAWASELALVRQVHRVAATSALIGALLLVVLARRARSSRAALAWSLLGVGLLLSVVGVVAGASRAAPVVLINLLGGFAMLALCVRLAASDERNGIDRAAAWLLALVALQAAGGAIASTQASTQCGLIADCSVVAVVHRLSGVLLALALFAWGSRTAWRAQRWEGAAMALIALLLLMMGVLAAGISGLSIPALVVVHNVLAAAALAVLAWCA